MISSGNNFYLFVAPSVILYLGIMIVIAKILKNNRNDKWVSLGSPDGFNISPKTGAKLSLYVLFSSSYKDLKDKKLDIYILLAKILFGLSVSGLVLGLFINL